MCVLFVIKKYDFIRSRLSLSKIVEMSLIYMLLPLFPSLETVRQILLTNKCLNYECMILLIQIKYKITNLHLKRLNYKTFLSVGK